MRSANTLKNAKYNLIFLIVPLLLSFVSRGYFIRILGVDIVGVNGLISNLLGFLNIAELGIGMAITYALYKPIATGDNKKISDIMYLFKHYYKKIAFIVLAGGIVMSFFLTFFIKGQVSLVHVYIYYYLFLFNTVISYFFIYKQTLIIADQKQYVVTVHNNITKIIKTIIQIITLIMFKSYILWIVLEIVFNVGNLMLINRKCDQIFKHIDLSTKRDISKIKLGNEGLIKNIRNVFVHKIASFVVFETDGILMTLILTLRDAGIYANYVLLINSVSTIIDTFMGSVTASIGDLVAEENHERSYGMFKKLYLIDCFVAIIVSYTLYCVINPFIALWVGKQYLFGEYAVIVLVVNLYIAIIRGTVDRYKSAYGIFWDNFAPITEAIVNLVLSFILAEYLGVIGLFIGTFVSNVLIVILWKPFVIYRYGFKQSIGKHVILFIKYTIIALIIVFISNLIRHEFLTLTGINLYSIVGFLVYSFVSLFIVTAITLIIYLSQKDFREVVKYAIQIKNSILRRG